MVASPVLRRQRLFLPVDVGVCRKAHALQYAVLGVVAVGVDAKQRCVADDAPRAFAARGVVTGIVADLDLEGAEAACGVRLKLSCHSAACWPMAVVKQLPEA